MKKLTKKQLEEIAIRMWSVWVFRRARHAHTDEELRRIWKGTDRSVRRHWLQAVQFGLEIL